MVLLVHILRRFPGHGSVCRSVCLLYRQHFQSTIRAGDVRSADIRNVVFLFFFQLTTLNNMGSLDKINLFIEEQFRPLNRLLANSAQGKRGGPFTWF